MHINGLKTPELSNGIIIIKNIFVKITLGAAVALLVQAPLFADVYRWVDQNGQVNYSDQPQSPSAKRLNSIKTQTKKAIPKKPSKEDKDTKSEEGKETSEKDTAESKDQKVAKDEKPKVSKKEKRRLCREGTDDYKKISSRGRVREINKKGEYVYLSEKQRQKRLAIAKKKKRKYCN